MSKTRTEFRGAAIVTVEQAIKAVDEIDKLESVEQWQLLSLNPRLSFWLMAFDRLKWSKPPSDAVTIAEGSLRIAIQNKYDAERFGVSEFGVYKFEDGKVSKLL